MHLLLVLVMSVFTGHDPGTRAHASIVACSTSLVASVLLQHDNLDIDITMELGSRKPGKLSRKQMQLKDDGDDSDEDVQLLGTLYATNKDGKVERKKPWEQEVPCLSNAQSLPTRLVLGARLRMNKDVAGFMAHSRVASLLATSTPWGRKKAGRPRRLCRRAPRVTKWKKKCAY